jgi:hypothetical protein
MDSTRADRKGDIIQSLNAGERLGYTFQFKKIFCHANLLFMFSRRFPVNSAGLFTIAKDKQVRR